MNTTNGYSKAALVLAAGAFIISAVNAGGPAIAGALGGNSDKVDGFDAVKSSTPVKQRKGKLVATSSKNGRLPNNIIKRAPNAKRLAGHPRSYFLGTAAAAAEYETAAHAGATYETATHADVTYQTKADAVANQNQTYLLQVQNTPLPAVSFDIVEGTFTTAVAGKIRFQTALQIDTACNTASWVAAWLTIDGAYVPGTKFLFEQQAELTTAVLVGVTADSIPAGVHSVEVHSGCLTATVNLVTYFQPPRIEAVVMRTGAPVVSRANPPGGLGSGTQCVMTVGSRRCR